MRVTRVWVDLDVAGNVQGHGAHLLVDGDLEAMVVDPNPDPFATPQEALESALRLYRGFIGEQPSLF